MKNTIYNNYDLYEQYDETKAYLQEEAYANKEPSEDDIWNEIYFQDKVNWEDEESKLSELFGNEPVILFGTVGRWNGNSIGAQIFDDFWKAFSWATKDCDCVHLYEENGHFFIKCSHHDGTNEFQLKIVSQRGYDFYYNWDMDYENTREPADIFNTIIKSNFLSRLPHYCKTVYGCKE